MYIGVDAGTSMTKAAAFDDRGRALRVVAERTQLLNPRDGWYEQDSDEVVASVTDVVRRLVVEIGEPPALIALTGQGDGVWPVDNEGRPTRPAISWMDARAADVLREWIDAGVADSAFRRTGNVFFPGCPAPVLAWLDRNEPGVLDRTATAAYCKDVVMQRFTGVRATDPSDASLPFLDPHARVYADDVLESCGLTHRAGLLAPVVEPCPTGQLLPEVAAQLGVPASTPVTAGPFDLAASALGAGVTAPGDGNLIVGTTLACQVVIDELDTSGEPAGLTLAYGPRGRWIRAMPAMVGTAALDWVLAMVGEKHVRVNEFLDASPPGARGVTCLPYFSPAGERAPFVEPGARARFDGLTLQTDKTDLVRAVCEAIAFAARHCFDTAGLRGGVAVCGGGIKSARWLQLFADVLGRPVRVAPKEEIGAYGAVVSGLAAIGSPVDVSEWAGDEVVVEPDSTRTSFYAERFEHYRTAVDLARKGWKA